MSRRWWLAGLSMAAFASPAVLAAQDGDGPPERIDILVPQEDYNEPLEDCSAEQEAASISGEIVVCRRRRSGAEFGYDEERAEQRYATETMDKDSPRAPDLMPVYPGVVVARGCFIPPCPPPPALIIDIEALPEAPPGSDADRIARGLAPIGSEGSSQPTPSARQEALGLPPPADSVIPSESASPEAAPSG